MPTQTQPELVISNEEIFDAFESGRKLLRECDIRPETLEDEPERRTEWRRGSVAPNLFCQATSGGVEQRAVTMWKYLLNI